MADSKQKQAPVKHDALAQKIVEAIYGPRAIPATKSPYEYYAPVAYKKEEALQMVREILSSPENLVLFLKGLTDDIRVHHESKTSVYEGSVDQATTALKSILTSIELRFKDAGV